MKTLIKITLLLLFCISSVDSKNSPKNVSNEGIHCGFWRWDVKTLSDTSAKQILGLHPKEVDFSDLLKLDTIVLRQIRKFPIPRKADEILVKVKGNILRYKFEDDNDLHVILGSGDTVIVCEIPSPLCDGAIQSGFSNEYAAARTMIQSLPYKRQKGWFVIEDAESKSYFVTGSIFHDFIHGASFSMPNCLEIHPVILIEPVM